MSFRTTVRKLLRAINVPRKSFLLVPRRNDNQRKTFEVLKTSEV